MKKFLARISKTPAAQKSGQSPGSQPRDSVPPVVTHPCPHEHIAILVTADGLLLRPHGQGVEHTGSYAMVRWAGEGTDGKVVRVAEGEVPEGETLDWDHSVVVYGIVGILELFSCEFVPFLGRGLLARLSRRPVTFVSASYLLVITSRTDLGQRESVPQSRLLTSFTLSGSVGAYT
jgi:hypothetical protein